MNTESRTRSDYRGDAALTQGDSIPSHLSPYRIVLTVALTVALVGVAVLPLLGEMPWWAEVIGASFLFVVLAVLLLHRFLARPLLSLLRDSAQANRELHAAKHQLEEQVDKAHGALERQQADSARTEALATQRNRELRMVARRMECQTRDIATLGEFASLVQSTEELAVAYALVSTYGQTLFPDTIGNLLILNESRTSMTAEAGWCPGAGSASTYDPDSCWAFRKGGVHELAPDRPALVCGHLDGQDVSSSICIPLQARGRTIGLLTLQQRRWARRSETSTAASERPQNERFCTESCADACSSFIGTRRHLVSVFAESVALGTSNIGMRAELRTMATRDELTALYNRRYMLEWFEREVRRAARKSSELGVLMMDVDRFKSFNDAHGHAAGDEVLHEFGRLLRAQFREEDIVCRYGGEEFVVVLPELDSRAVRARAEELLREVRALQVRFAGKLLAPVTASVGVAMFPVDGETTKSLLARADAAMYRAKERGRDRCEMAGSTTDGEAQAVVSVVRHSKNATPLQPRLLEGREEFSEKGGAEGSRRETEQQAG